MSLGWNKDPAPKAALLLLSCPSFVSASPPSLPWLATAWKAFVPRSPTGSCLVSFTAHFWNPNVLVNILKYFAKVFLKSHIPWFFCPKRKERLDFPSWAQKDKTWTEFSATLSKSCLMWVLLTAKGLNQSQHINFHREPVKSFSDFRMG